MTISKKREKSIQPNIYMDDVSIGNVSQHKHLGVTFSDNGTWNNHVLNVIQTASTKLTLLRKLKFSVDRKSL